MLKTTFLQKWFTHKKHFYSFVILGMLMCCTNGAYGQISINQNFDASTTIPSGWYDNPTNTSLNISSTLSCSGNSVRYRLRSAKPTFEIGTTNAATSNGQHISVSFKYKLTNQSDGSALSNSVAWGAINLEYSTNGGTNWNTYHTIDNTNHTPSTSCATLTKTITTVTNGQNVLFRWTGAWSTVSDYFFYLDDVSITQASGVGVPGCTYDPSLFGATNVPVTTNLSWTYDPDVPNVYINLGTTPNGTDVLNNVSAVYSTYSYDIPFNLEYNTTYYLNYLPYNSNGFPTSCYPGWQTTFTTEAALTPPFTQSFTTYLPTQWKESQGELNTTLSGTTSTWAQANFGNTGTNKAARFNTYGSALKEWLISPPIDLGDGSTKYKLEFDLALTPFTGTATTTLASDDKFKVVISTDGGATWSSANVLREWGNGDAISNTGEHITILLGAYTGVVNLGFYGESTVNNSDLFLYVDNVEVAPYVIYESAAWSNITGPTETVDAIINDDYNESADIITKDLEVNAGKTVTIKANDKLNVNGNLTNNGTIKFESTSSGDGIFRPYTGAPIAGTGTVNVERYVGAKRAWRMITTPLKGNSGNTVFENWQNNGTEATGTGGNLWSSGGTIGTTGMHSGTSSNILKYPTTAPATAWTSVTNTKTEPLFTSTINKAFSVFVTGPYTTTASNITSGANATTLSATGALITGDQVYATSDNSIHTLIGNPYASPLIPASILNDAANSANFSNIWVWDPSLSTYGGYIVYDTSTGWSNTTESYANGPSTMLQSGLAFFVKPTTNSATLTIKEAHKGTTVTTGIFDKSRATTNPVEQIRVALFKNNNSVWQNEDAVVAAFSPTGDNALTSNDAEKMFKGGENLAIDQSGTSLTIAHRNVVASADVVALKVTSGINAANYKFVVHTVDYAGLTPYLYDNVLNTHTQLPTNGSTIEYPFSFSNAAAETQRFSIVFNSGVLNAADFTAAKIEIYPNPAHNFVTIDFPASMETLAYTLYNVLGQKVKEGTCTQTKNTIDVNQLNKGFYNLEIRNQNTRISKSLIIK